MHNVCIFLPTVEVSGGIIPAPEASSFLLVLHLIFFLFKRMGSGEGRRCTTALPWKVNKSPPMMLASWQIPDEEAPYCQRSCHNNGTKRKPRKTYWVWRCTWPSVPVLYSLHAGKAISLGQGGEGGFPGRKESNSYLLFIPLLKWSEVSFMSHLNLHCNLSVLCHSDKEVGRKFSY